MDHAHSIFQVSTTIEFCASIYPTYLFPYTLMRWYISEKGEKTLNLLVFKLEGVFFIVFLLKVKGLPTLTAPLTATKSSPLFSAPVLHCLENLNNGKMRLTKIALWLLSAPYLFDFILLFDASGVPSTTGHRSMTVTLRHNCNTNK